MCGNCAVSTFVKSKHQIIELGRYVQNQLGGKGGGEL